MEWRPSARATVEKLALPPDKAAVPTNAVPSKNVTVPVETVAPVDELTRAVKVIDELSARLLVEDESVMVVSTVPAATVMDTAEDLDALKVEVPAYAAVIALTPMGSDEALNVAVPEFSCAVPRETVPL